jgi:hypothetical protein
VDAHRRSELGVRPLLAGAMLAFLGLSLSACSEIETETPAGYEPATLQALEGRDDLKRVTLTAEGARRIGLETAEVDRSGGQKTVPYAALIYDPEGAVYVYTGVGRRSYLREQVEVQRIDGHQALLSRGPPMGTTVVTVGAAEVHGAELEIASQ